MPLKFKDLFFEENGYLSFSFQETINKGDSISLYVDINLGNTAELEIFIDIFPVTPTLVLSRDYPVEKGIFS